MACSIGNTGKQNNSRRSNKRKITSRLSLSLGLVAVLMSYSLFTIPSTFTLLPFYSTISQAAYAFDNPGEKCKWENNCAYAFYGAADNPPVEYCDPPHSFNYAETDPRRFYKWCFWRVDVDCPINTPLQDIGGVLQCPGPCPPGERCSDSDESNCNTLSHILLEDGTCFPISCTASGGVRGSPGYINSEGGCNPVNPPPPPPTQEERCKQIPAPEGCPGPWEEAARAVWNWGCEAIPFGGRVPLGWGGLCPD